ncbi:MAG: hypothetical protein NVS2B12_09680 [Ktedonobacteraceae bacterium]
MVQVPGTMLDTNNSDDVFGITEMVTLAGKMTLSRLTQFNNTLYQLDRRTPFEDHLLILLVVAIARLQDLKDTYNSARTQESIWCKGSLFYYERQGHGEIQQGPITSELARASRDHVQLHYATRVLASVAPFIQYAQQVTFVNSQGDCEVKVLEDLSDYIHDQAQGLYTNLQQGLISRIHIIIAGSMGPCDDCKGRIVAFLIDIAALAHALQISIPVFLEVNYTTPTNADNRSQYGYSIDTRVDVGRGGRATSGALPDEFSYWTRTFSTTFG